MKTIGKRGDNHKSKKLLKNAMAEVAMLLLPLSNKKREICICKRRIFSNYQNF